MFGHLGLDFGWPFPWGWCAGIALSAAAVGWLWWKWTLRDVSPRKALWLAGLRLGALVLLVLYLLEPMVRVYETRSMNPRAVIWVDASASMRFPARAGGPDRYSAALETAGEMKRAFEKRGMRVDVFPFASEAIDGRPPGRDSLLPGPTDLSAPLNASGPYRAAVLVTDGCHNAAADLSKAVAEAAARGMGVFVVRVGEGLFNLSLDEVKLKRRVGVATRMELTARVSVTAGDPKALGAERPQLELSDEKGNVLGRLPVRLEPGSRSYSMEVELREPGFRRFVLSLTPLEGEVVPEDNFAPIAVSVFHRPLKVLYMEGSEYRRPDRKLWEHQFLEQALEEDPDIDVTVLLRDEIPEARALGVWWVKHPEHGYPRTRAGLFDYDVIISSDIDIDYFTEDQLRWTVEFVAEHGGGFAMVGGWTAFGPGGYDNSVMDKMLPVDMLGRFEHYVENEEFRWRLTREAWSHPIMRIDPDPEKNRAIWESMPPFFGHNRVERKKPAAVVLAVHPADRNLYGPAVVLAVQEFGLGRSMALTTDTTAGWGQKFEDEWGEGGDNRYYKKFWKNAVKWLGAYRLTAPERHVLVSTGRAFYDVGQDVDVSVEVRDEEFKPGGDVRDLQVSAAAPSGEEVPVAMKRTSGGKYRGVFRAVVPGEYELSGRVVLLSGREEEDRIAVPVRKADVEAVRPVPEAGFLERAFGRENVFRPEDAGALVERVNALPRMTAKYRDFEPMHSWMVLAAVMGLLFLEWGLRKRWGLP